MLKRGVLDTRKVPDVTFVREEGIDAEGLTKEFFSLVMNVRLVAQGAMCCLKEKLTDHLVPINSEEWIFQVCWPAYWHVSPPQQCWSGGVIKSYYHVHGNRGSRVGKLSYVSERHS